MTSCDGVTCCEHTPECEAVLNRDGVLYLVCVECNTEREPAPPITCSAIGVPELVTSAAPCGDDIAHRWGSPL